MKEKPKPNSVGRPQYEPTPEDRAFVENAAAVGIPHTTIGEKFGIDPKTLRKHFRIELNDGMLKAHMQVGGGLFNMATKSKDERVRFDASKWYSACQMGWSPKVINENTGKDGGPIETEVRDVTARDLFESRIARLADRRGESGGTRMDS